MGDRLREIAGILLDRWPDGSFERQLLMVEVLPEMLGQAWMGSGATEATTRLAPLLGDPDQTVRRRAIDALARIHRGTGQEGLTALERLGLDREPRCRDDLPRVRAACMADAPWEARLSVAEPDLCHPSPGRRLAAIRGLATDPPHPPEAYGAILEAVRGDDDFALRCEALECAGRVLAGRATGEILRGMESMLDERQRRQALDAGYSAEVALALAVRGGDMEAGFRASRVLPLLTAEGHSRRRGRLRLAGLRGLVAGAEPPEALVAAAASLVVDSIRTVRWHALWALAEASWAWPGVSWTGTVPV
ncbi:MAG: hypothetical protein GF320_05985, partial [Armatimonadia bacterium]|nr:hypothetical protein [Armatimonadia bacterium]